MSEFNSDAINKVIINAVSGRKNAPKSDTYLCLYT